MMSMNSVRNIPSEDQVKALPPILAVDFDGTLVEFTYRGIGEPIWPAVDAVKSYKKAGYKIILWSCRTDDNEDKELSSAVKFCSEILGIEFDAVNDNIPEVLAIYGNTRKIHANIYFDDKGVNTLEAYACKHPGL